jgi:hypothetical protein
LKFCATRTPTAYETESIEELNGLTGTFVTETVSFGFVFGFDWAKDPKVKHEMPANSATRMNDNCIVMELNQIKVSKIHENCGSLNKINGI